MDVTEIRAKNVTMLVEKHGGPTAFGQRIARDQVQVSQWTSPSNPKPIGGRLARYIEETLGHGKGWLDHPQWLASAVGEPVSHYGDLQGDHPSSTRLVQVKGLVIMSSDGFWEEVDFDDPCTMGMVPARRAGEEAYALKVKNDVLFPAIRAGWFVVVKPGAPLVQNEFVMITMLDGRSTIKELLWHRGDEFGLQAVNTVDRMTVSRSDIRAIEPVGGVLPPSDWGSILDELGLSMDSQGKDDGSKPERG